MPLLNIPEELVELRSSLRQFLDREVRPVEDEHRQEIQETATFQGLKDVRATIRKRSAELGFWTLHMPEEVGGGGLSYLGQVLLHEEAASDGLILAQIESVFPVVSGPTPIYLDCTPAQRPGSRPGPNAVATAGGSSTGRSTSSPEGRRRTSPWCSR